MSIRSRKYTEIGAHRRFSFTHVTQLGGAQNEYKLQTSYCLTQDQLATLLD